MNVNSQHGDGTSAGIALRWAGRVVTADGLRESLNGERELVVTPRTVITPLAADHLKAYGVRVVRQEENAKPQAKAEGKLNESWGYILERPDPRVASVVQSLKREGVNLQELSTSRQAPAECENRACGLAREAAQVVSRGDSMGAIVFCVDPLLACCIANKVKGIRAAALVSPAQANQAVKGLGINFLALGFGQQTFFELRQILRCLCGGPAACPGAVAEILKDLEGGCQCQSQSHGPPSVGLEHKCHCGGGHAHR
jgi:ribose 5-phosphate isomerase RpiB